MALRSQIPKEIEAAVLLQSGRRCCICFGLRRDAGVRKGQIAHLDHDPQNNSIENLAFLCLEHHDEYDSRTQQSKGLTKREVKKYRDRLHEYCRTLPTCDYSVLNGTTDEITQTSRIGTPPVIQSLIRRLTQRLIRDFSYDGDHAGEFGRTASAIEQETWAAGGPDRVAVKPWYYLTYWGVRGLSLADPNALAGLCSTIVSGIEKRIGARWLQVLVNRSSVYDTVPGEPDKMIVKSYRHTIRGANILTLLVPDSRTSLQVLCDILDPEQRIQNQDGGWPQTDKVYTSSDLWTSAYVLRFIADILSQPGFGIKKRDSAITHQIHIARQTTNSYLEREWKERNWVYREMPSRAVLPKFLVEIAGLVDWTTSLITQPVVESCLGQLTQAGRIRNEHELERNGITELQQLIRIGFALYQINAVARLDLDDVVHQVRDQVIRMINDASMLGPEDASFCIHLAMEKTP